MPPEAKPEAVIRPPARVLAWSESRVDEREPFARPAIAFWLPEGINAAIGLSQNPQTELDVEAMRRDGVGLIRRQSGGGAVLLYDGVLCWEALTGLEAIERSNLGDSGIRASYEFLCRPVVAALRELGVAAFRAGICDVSVETGEGGQIRKVAGTAQLRRRQKALVHGSLLLTPDVKRLARYLRMPGDQPDYRRGRTHRDFCVSVAEHLSIEPARRNALTFSFIDAAAKAALELGWDVLTPPERLEGQAAALERDKYATAEWNWFKARNTAGEGGAFENRRAT